jgi:hypothetical protein
MQGLSNIEFEDGKIANLYPRHAAYRCGYRYFVGCRN